MLFRRFRTLQNDKTLFSHLFVPPLVAHQVKQAEHDEHEAGGEVDEQRYYDVGAQVADVIAPHPAHARQRVAVDGRPREHLEKTRVEGSNLVMTYFFLGKLSTLTDRTIIFQKIFLHVASV